MKDELIEDVIRISNQLRVAKELLCQKYCRHGACGNCPLYGLNDCDNYYSLAYLKYNREIGGYI